MKLVGWFERETEKELLQLAPCAKLSQTLRGTGPCLRPRGNYAGYHDLGRRANGEKGCFGLSIDARMQVDRGVGIF
jgi:hypothetical protein